MERILISILLFTLSNSFAQDLPGGTRITPTVVMLREFKKMDLIAAKALAQTNERIDRCRVSHAPFKDLMDLYDGLSVYSELKTLNEKGAKEECQDGKQGKTSTVACLIKPQTLRLLNTISKNKYFSVYLNFKYPRHRPLKPEEFLKSFSE
jgi:hypothetical protein